MLIEFKVNRMAQILGVHRNTVTNWIKSGKLKAKPSVAKRYVIKREDIEALFNEEGVSLDQIDKLKITNGSNNKNGNKLRNTLAGNMPTPIKKKSSINLLVL